MYVKWPKSSSSRYEDECAVCDVVAQYNSKMDSCASHTVGPSTTLSSLGEVAALPVQLGSSSCCYDNGLTGAAVSPGLWCHGKTDVKLVDTWSSSNEDLAELFSRIGLSKYTDIFQQQEVSEYLCIKVEKSSCVCTT